MEGRDGRRTAQEIETSRLGVAVSRSASKGGGRDVGNEGSHGLQGRHD